MSSQENTQENTPNTKNAESASFKSRLLAIVYDGLIILFLSTVVVLIIQLILIGDNEIPADHILNKILKPVWFVPGFFYLAYYWTKCGQTPSMKVWNIKVVNKQGLLISWPQALLRYAFALLGIGLIWMLFNKNRLALQDVGSNSYLIKTNTTE